MADSLYGEDDLDEEDIDEYDDEEETYDTEYKRSMKWDPVLGDFARDSAHRVLECEGREAYMIWCLKQVVTQRASHMAYLEEVTGYDLGVEIDEALREVDHASVEAYLESTIKEAIEMNAKTEWVGNFTFEWDGDDVHILFQVKGIEWDDVITINT